MIAVLVFAIVLLIAILLSGLTHRSVLSTAVLFLVGGFIVGQDALRLIQIEPDDPFVETFVELVLFSVLFTDGMQLKLRDLISECPLPVRALLLGMPLTFLAIAILVHLIAGLSLAVLFWLCLF